MLSRADPAEENLSKDPSYCSLAQAADHLGVEYFWIERAVRKNKLKAYKYKEGSWFLWEDIERISDNFEDIDESL